MFEKLLKALLAPAPAPLTDSDARMALAALLVRVARTDHFYAAEEVERIDAILSQRYGLSPFEVADLRGQAEVLESQAPDTIRFTRALKDAVPLDERAALVQALWSVALIDGSRDGGEDQMLRLIANLLGLTDVESGLARQRAQAALK
ncbi:MAG: TerB family tellurite resistance protein [Cypionkella sp.]|nr:TerB family tellurite resistance protein [Cypionkella sp.]